MYKTHWVEHLIKLKLDEWNKTYQHKTQKKLFKINTYSVNFLINIFRWNPQNIDIILDSRFQEYAYLVIASKNSIHLPIVRVQIFLLVLKNLHSTMR